MKQVFIRQKVDQIFQVELIITAKQRIVCEGVTITEAMLKAKVELMSKIIHWDHKKTIYTKHVIAARALKRRLGSFVSEEMHHEKAPISV